MIVIIETIEKGNKNRNNNNNTHNKRRRRNNSKNNNDTPCNNNTPPIYRSKTYNPSPGMCLITRCLRGCLRGAYAHSVCAL